MAVLRACLSVTAALVLAACGTIEAERNPPEVTVSLFGRDARAGGCPTRPGDPSSCLYGFTGSAVFREGAGTEAQVTDVSIRKCGTRGCLEIGAVSPGPPYVVPPRGVLVVGFTTFYDQNLRPERIVLTATVVWAGDSYPVEAQVEVQPGS